MIVLNVNKELVRVESWEDIQGRPGFTDNLDPEKQELSDIIGQYAFSEKIRCGLSNCHTPHAKGYLVVTKSGCETNIGKDCGKAYFGVDFEKMAANFDRDMRDKENRELLWGFSFRLDGLKGKIGELRGGELGADVVYKNLIRLKDVGKGVPDVVVRRVASMIKTGNSSLFVDREATQEEFDRETARVGSVRRPLVISEKVADVRGFEALYSENDLRELLVIQLGEEIKRFEKLDIDVMVSRDLSKWSKFVGGVEEKMDRAKRSLELGIVLLTKGNLSPFSRLIDDEEEKENFAKFLNSL